MMATHLEDKLMKEEEAISSVLMLELPIDQ
jgi:hypothetical protein